MGGSAAIPDSPNPVQPGVWYHLAIVRNNNSFTFYLNGNQICQACTVPAGSAPPSGTLRLARLADGGTDNDHETQHYGFVDDVAIFKRALTAGEIMNLALSSAVDRRPRPICTPATRSMRQHPTAERCRPRCRDR